MFSQKILISQFYYIYIQQQMSKSGLGKAIKNKLQKKHRAGVGSKAPIFYQESQQNKADIRKQKMQSVIQQSSLNQFLQTAELTQQNFQANRNIKFREIRQEVKKKKIIVLDDKPVLIEDQVDQNQLKGLQMPRRPTWKDKKSKQELQKAEVEAYLQWRRNLAELEQENPEIQVTPYEKNIEVWRQLWRVAQRSDLLVQIVDGRDPLFYRSEDLVNYVQYLNPHKKSLLVINKSDLIPEEVIKRWNEYLLKRQITHVFFSAKKEQDSQEQEIVETEDETQTEKIIIEGYCNKPEILSKKKLINLFIHYIHLFEGKETIEVGLVGYPNVGKSSVINTLLGKKKVGVASMPGKTKHFQTLKLNQRITLCDCPGLVFPRISSSHAYMILNGLFPLDTLKNFQEAIEIMTHRVAQVKFEELYGIHWKEQEVFAWDTLLSKYATLKGFFTGNGLPNVALAARNILKDYVSGTLQYARNPPGLVGEEYHGEQKEKKTIREKEEQIPEIKKEKIKQRQLDQEFFNQEMDEKMTQAQIIQLLTQEDLLDLIEGKKIGGLKTTKDMRKQIKHALKRGEDLDKIKKQCFGLKKDNHKNLIRN